MRTLAILSLAVALSFAGLTAVGADDAIGKLMHDQNASEEGPARSLPVAPPKPIPNRSQAPASAPNRKGRCPS